MSDPHTSDARRVRRASLGVGLWVAATSALIIALGVIILVIVLFATARPERRGDPAVGSAGDADRIVVDIDHVIPIVVVLGVAGVAILSVIAWLAARRAVGPLADALRLQRAFVSDASHELRTPLTALTSRIQIIQRRRARGEPMDDQLLRLRSDATALDDVLTDLLVVAEDAASPTRTADVARAVHETIALLAPVAETHQLRLTPRTADNIHVAVAPSTLTRMLVALVDNAVQHAPAGSSVDVDARPGAGVVELRITDGGSGIAEADRSRVFERFARGGESGRRRGFGLGLALVREAAERAGGSIQIASTSAAGTTFLLRLPRA